MLNEEAIKSLGSKRNELKEIVREHETKLSALCMAESCGFACSWILKSKLGKENMSNYLEYLCHEELLGYCSHLVLITISSGRDVLCIRSIRFESFTTAPINRTSDGLRYYSVNSRLSF